MNSKRYNFNKKAFVFFTLLNCLFVTSQQNISPNWTIEQCIDQAWKSNNTIKQTENNRINSQYDLEFNRAGFHPNLNLSYSNGYNWGRSIDPTTYQFVTGGVNTNNLTLSSTMTLFDGFSTPNRIKESKVGLEMADAEVKQQKNAIAISIAGAYLQILLAHEREEILLRQLISTRELLKLTTKNIELGSKSALDLLQIKSQIALEKADSVEAYTILQLAKLSLLQLIEIPYSPTFEIERFDSKKIQQYSIISNSDEVYNSALLVVPEIQNANLEIQYKTLDLKVKQGGYFPVLSLNGRIVTNYASSSKKILKQEILSQEPIGYLFSDPSQTVIGNQSSMIPIVQSYPYRNQLSDNFNTSLSLILSIPIYSKKQNLVNTGKALVAVNQAKLELENKKNVLRKDIETAYLDYMLLTNRLLAVNEKRNAYVFSYGKIQKQFELNTTSSYELLVEKNKLISAENEIVQLQYQILFKNIILKYYQSGEIKLPPL